MDEGLEHETTAVFFDRDNTLIANDGYLGDPDGVVLVDGAAERGRTGARPGLRGRRVQQPVRRRARDVRRGGGPRGEPPARRDAARRERPAPSSTATSSAPITPRRRRAYRQDSDLRKPKPGMILQAERQLALDLPRSWVVGDAPRDIDAGQGRGVPDDPGEERRRSTASEAALQPGEGPADFEVESLAEAMEVIARRSRVGTRRRNHRPPNSRPQPNDEARMNELPRDGRPGGDRPAAGEAPAASRAEPVPAPEAEPEAKPEPDWPTLAAEPKPRRQRRRGRAQRHAVRDRRSRDFCR